MKVNYEIHVPAIVLQDKQTAARIEWQVERKPRACIVTGDSRKISAIAGNPGSHFPVALSQLTTSGCYLEPNIKMQAWNSLRIF